MYCPNCGQQQSDDTKFCSNCGADLQTVKQEPNPTPTPAAVNQNPTPQPVQQPIQPPTQQPAQPKLKKPWYKKWWIWVIVGVVVVGVIGGAFGEKTDGSKDSSGSSSSVSSASSGAEKEKATEAKEEKTEAPEPATEDPETVKKEFIDSCETVDYSTLARNPDNYKGDHLKYTGQVIQVLDSKSVFNKTTTLRVNVTAEDNQFAEGGKLWKDTIICAVTIPDGGDRILENDIIDLYGVCEGLYTYETVLGNNESVPRVDIEYYTIHEK